MNAAITIQDGLYHKLLGFPQSLLPRLWQKFSRLTFGHHAKRACIDDRYGLVQPPRGIEVTTDNLIEIEVARGNPVKFVVRIPANETCDMVLVVVPDGPDCGFVKTVWLNEKNDNHQTLRRELYRRPPK